MSKEARNMFDQFAANQEMPNYTIGDILELMETEPDIDGTIIGGFSQRMQCYSHGLENGFLTVDEVRKLERLPQLSNDKE